MATPRAELPKKTILIVAGEASGDRLGGALMAALKAKNANLRFIGVGGDTMQEQGLKPLFPMSYLSVMGLFEVIPAIPRILGRLKDLQELAHQKKPDMVITIDSQDFSIRLAKKLKPLGIPHIQYVAPKVWAWRQGRAAKLKQAYTHLLTILPFEPAFFKNYKLESTYVGHPAVSMLEPYRKAKKVGKEPVLALLPGSRTGELNRHWPLFLQAYRQVRQTMPELKAVLALPNEKTLLTCQQLAGWTTADAIETVYGEERFGKLANATAALTKSGTNNLELALLGTPAIVTYRMNPLTYQLAKRLVNVRYVSLPNLILHKAGKRVAYPEFLQHAANANKLAEVTGLLLGKGAAYKAQTEALQTLQSCLKTPKPPAVMAADIVFNILKNKDEH